MRKVQIYIEGERLELFDDETIQVTSSVQNVQDIAKVFTDFSQSFTVPGSEHNNKIFQHFYENAIDTTLDYQVRKSARIEIDLIPFRTGKIQLEKSNVKKGKVESYTITFYGDVRTLQDYFGEDKLAVLDYSAYTHTYSGSEIQTRITSNSSYDVRYPLISSNRLWVYGGGGSEDISQNSHHMHYYELFPALRIARIFDAIEAYYGISFIGTFLSDNRFLNAYLHLKNAETFTFETNPQKIDFTYYSGYNTTGYIQRDVFNTTDDTLHIEYDTEDIYPSTGSHSLIFTCSSVSDNAATYYIDVYSNGVLETTLSGQGTGVIDTLIYGNDVGLNKTFYFVVRANASINIDIDINYNQYRTEYYDDGSGNLSQIYLLYIFTATTSALTLTATLDINGNIPDLTISDFVKGILKEFNLTISPLSPTTFELMPLEDWYAKGRILDITEHTDIDSIDVERVKLFKKISFKYQQSESFLNRVYADAFAHEYGDLEQSYDYDGSEYLVESPFENLRHNKFTGTNLQVGYYLDRNYNKYIPKPVLLYMDTQKSVSFYFNDGSTTSQLTTYMPFGQDTVSNGLNYTLNFGNEISTLKDVNINKHLFNTYYSAYLNNLYVKKNRLVYVKCYFPIPLLATIRLNDRLIIRDKRYIINEIKANLTTGEIDLVLLHDFRKTIRTKLPILSGKLGGVVKSPVILPNKCVQADLNVGTSGITISTPTIYEDTNVEFTLPANSTPADLLIDENGTDYLDTEDMFILRSEEGVIENLIVEITYTYEDGSTETDEINFQISDL